MPATFRKATELLAAAHLGTPSLRKIPARLSYRRFALPIILSGTFALSAAAQDARWLQLSQQVVQLNDQGKIVEAIPMAQEAVRVAEATYGPADRHLGLSLNVLGVLLKEREQLADADACFRRALTIMAKASGAESRDVATVLDNLGDLYRTKGQYPDAEKFIQQALSIHEKVLGLNDHNVATDASNLALVYVEEGKYADAERLYHRAIAIDEEQTSLGNNDLSSDLSGLGNLLVARARYADAEPLFVRALSIDLKMLGKDNPQIEKDLSNLAHAYMYEGKFSAAEPVFQRALAIVNQTQGPESSAGASILEGMGTLFREEGRYADSEAAYQHVLANREKALGPDHPDVARLLDNFGSLYANENRYAEAENLYRHALAIREKRLGPFHPDVALTLINLANLYSAHGRWGEAETMYRNALTVYLKAYGQEDPRVAGLLSSAGNLLMDEGKLPDAERVLQGALAIDEKLDGPNSASLVPSLNLLAQVYEYEGKHSNAETLYKRSIDITEKAVGENSPKLAVYLIGLAAVYKDEEKYDEAEPLFRRAMTILEGKLPADDPTLGEAQMNLAVFYYAWDKPDLAGSYFDKRLGNLMNQFRTNASTMSEKDRLIFFATVPGAFPLFYSFVDKYHDREPALAGKMYDALLQEKGFIAESAAAMRARIESSGDKEALAMLEKLTAEKTQLAALVESTVGDPANRSGQIAQLSQETNQLEQQIVKRSSALSEAKTLSVATWRDVQKALKPGEAAVEFARFQFYNGKSFTGNILYVALVVTPEAKSPAFIVLGDSRNLESTPLANYRAVVAQTRGISAEPEPGTTARGEEPGSTSAAYDAFWKPLEPSLGNAKRVFFAPDGVLNQIPIGLLADSSGKLLLEKYQLRSLNSTKDLLRPNPPPSTKSAVLLGNPKFDLTEAEQREALAELNGKSTPGPQSDSAPSFGMGQRSVDLSGGALNPLPGTQLEVNAIDKLLNASGWQAAMFTGDRALKVAIEKVRSPRVVHIATHGFFLSDQELAQKSGTSGGQRPAGGDPMLRSGLFFAGADRVRAGTVPAPGLDDGVLTAYEASQLDLQGTELVVLSACETGLGQQSNSEGVFGLRRGLQEAGAAAVMMSMWSVPDRETQELMTLFYAKWLGGLDKPEALRQAQLGERETVRERYGKDLPFYWGAFVLVGR
jgi:CHAT domain-containing protein/Tfp pilus assembly protein PilF